MKFKIIIVGLGIVLGGMMASCNDDFLDRPSEDQVEAPYFFNTAKDLEVATNDFYRAFSRNSDEKEWTDSYTDDAGSDNLMPLNPSAKVRGSRVVPVARGSGGWNWDDLRKINYFLVNYHKVKDEAAKAKYGGIARFFRAFFYYDKVKTFGDVPWYSGVLDAKDPELYKGRDSRTLVMDSVMADLDFAIANIPAEKQVNLITRYTAMLLKARVALFEGTFRKYHGLDDADKYLTLAAAAAQDLISSNAYTLYTEGGVENAYRNLFARNNQDNIETILAINFELGLKVHSLGSSFTSATQGSYGIPKDLVNSYLMRDGSRFTDKANYRTMGFLEEMQNRDPRLTQTTAGPDFRVIGESKNEPVNLSITTTGYRLIKALPDRSQWATSGAYFDIILFRYAEALLVFAEAKAELGTLTQGDLNISINKLRTRSGMPNLDMAQANANPDPYLLAMYPNVKGMQGVILEIRRERRAELFNEGFRWDDLMRWKEGLKVNQPIVGVYFPGVGAYDFTGDGQADVFVHTGSTAGAPSSVTSMVNIKQRTLWDPLTGQQGASAGNIDPFPNRGGFREDRDYFAPIPSEELLLNRSLEQNDKWDE
ncbi:RagB/SusD family nutrient uptake outer membrane protein [Sphingobacterium faecale]|uniref:RagB/SusD family nutrient uptake outer membrane protein n=1 Tax=Sphingobacterium faecale TaxID=2803775 RepID=A0ABS1R6X1_9SPHI|nr:RagB/SusD family nutrient uptake outer membrane protein [Sphingobacterium faecale]MBL1410309.1 RagB/SusD family nutrient uptake outer membrane protein [Sphingobacterium faecale]